MAASASCGHWSARVAHQRAAALDSHGHQGAGYRDGSKGLGTGLGEAGEVITKPCDHWAIIGRGSREAQAETTPGSLGGSREAQPTEAQERLKLKTRAALSTRKS
jgi:hypothetical protein